jgi:hypothetical protein
VVAAEGLILYVADKRLFFRSPAAGGDTTINSDLNKITALFGDGAITRHLTINEDQGAFPAATDIAGLTGVQINVLLGDLTLNTGGLITDDDASMTADIQAQNVTVNVNGGSLPLAATRAAPGNIVLTAANDLTITSPSPTGTPVPAFKGTQVIGTAGGTAVIENGARVISSTGIVGRVPPVEGGSAFIPQIQADGLATFNIDIGVPGDTNYTLVIDWRDGTVDTFSGLAAGSHTFTHVYPIHPVLLGLLPGTPADPIPVQFQLIDDPNISFTDGRAASTLPGIDGTFEIDGDLNQISGTTLAEVPGEGLGGKRIDTTAKVELLGIPRTQSGDTLVRSFQGESGLEQFSEVRAAVADLVTAEDDAVILEVLSPTDEILGKPIELRLDVLKDLNALYRRLPDGRYRLLLRRDGRELPIFREVLVIRGGRLIDPNRLEDTQDKPPGTKAPAKDQPPAKEMSREDVERLWNRLLAERPGQFVSIAQAPQPTFEPQVAEDLPVQPTAGPSQSLQPVDKTLPTGEVEDGVLDERGGQRRHGPLAAAAAVAAGLIAGKGQQPGNAENTMPTRPRKAGLVARFFRRLKRWLGTG